MWEIFENVQIMLINVNKLYESSCEKHMPHYWKFGFLNGNKTKAAYRNKKHLQF